MSKRPHTQRLQQDVKLLLPSFQPYVAKLLQAMRDRGFQPMVWETLRSPERAEWLASRGRSRNKGRTSMHVLGAAVDIVCRLRMWNHPEFFQALEEEAEKLGLVSGRDWDSNDDTENNFNDGPHVQALPLKDQKKLRALKTPAERETFIAKVLKNASDRAKSQNAPALQEEVAAHDAMTTPSPGEGLDLPPYSHVDTSDRTDAENEAQACLPEDEG